MSKVELSEQIRWIESTIKKNVSLHLLLSDSKILLESIKQLQAENEAMRKDAARYQWIKTGFSPLGLEMSGNHAWQYRVNPSKLNGANIDEAIDKAMEQTK